MASYSKIAITATVLLLSLSSLHPAAAATIKAGDKCSPVGATFKQGSTNFQCVKKATGGVWKAEKKATVETFVMPKVTGMNLQLAQDLLQSKGSYLMDQEDAKGLSRFQIIDSAWKVCSQSPSAGKKVPTSTIVVLKSVKLTESCP